MHCKYCRKLENKQVAPCLSCKECCHIVHLECLAEKKTPGNFSGDVFFAYTCAECSPSGKEIFERSKMSWLHILLISLNDLSTKCMPISNQGYFHWRTHIGLFINKNWNYLFHPQFKRKKNWAGTFSGILSHFSNIFFQSGSVVLNESGWWKLSHNFSPALIKYLNTEIVATKQKERLNRKFTPNTPDKVIEYAIMEKLLINLDLHYLIKHEAGTLSNNIIEEHPLKKQKIEPLPILTKSILSNESEDTGLEDYMSNYFVDGEESLSDLDNFLPEFGESESSSSNFLQNETNSMQPLDYHSNYPSSSENADNDSICPSPYSQTNKLTVFSEESNDSRVEINSYQNLQNLKEQKIHYAEIEAKHAPEVSGFFTISDPTRNCVYPWENASKVKEEVLIPLTEYEEIHMLNHLNTLCQKSQFVNVDKKLVRLRSKLSLRKLKRSKHIAPFNIDSVVCKISNLPLEDSTNSFLQQDVRILDRFQYIPENLSGTTFSSHLNFATRLAGHSEATSFVSPYSGRLLKPYIRRDVVTIPPWLKLMNELKLKVNKYQDKLKSDRSPLDYCYVRPQHIASINSLCAQFFWPGIDLTESLQYPDFSCVVLYKKIIVGFAFLVPDVGPNEAYISYVFTRPGWRKCGIANFMLYHLIQTCLGKDITLHVSATNSAIFLYQKFGFKIEELIQEFYEKYFPADSTECRHALFLRLCR